MDGKNYRAEYSAPCGATGVFSREDRGMDAKTPFTQNLTF
jgi:hypothetical protein